MASPNNPYAQQQQQQQQQAPWGQSQAAQPTGFQEQTITLQGNTAEDDIEVHVRGRASRSQASTPSQNTPNWSNQGAELSHSMSSHQGSYAGSENGDPLPQERGEISMAPVQSETAQQYLRQQQQPMQHHVQQAPYQPQPAQQQQQQQQHGGYAPTQPIPQQFPQQQQPGPLLGGPVQLVGPPQPAAPQNYPQQQLAFTGGTQLASPAPGYPPPGQFMQQPLPPQQPGYPPQQPMGQPAAFQPPAFMQPQFQQAPPQQQYQVAAAGMPLQVQPQGVPMQQLGHTGQPNRAPISLPGQIPGQDSKTYGAVILSKLREESQDAALQSSIAGATQEQVAALVSFLASNSGTVLHLCEKERGKVVTQILERTGGVGCEEIVMAMCSNIIMLATNRIGCVSLTRTVKALTSTPLGIHSSCTEMLTSHVIRHFTDLALHENGNFVCSAVIGKQASESAFHNAWAIVFKASPKFFMDCTLSKSGSHVIDALVNNAPRVVLEDVVLTVMQPEPKNLTAMAESPVANYPLQAFIKTLRGKMIQNNSLTTSPAWLWLCEAVPKFTTNSAHYTNILVALTGEGTGPQKRRKEMQQQ